MSRLGSMIGRLLDLPEVNLAIFAFLLNFVWEMWQVPLFAGMPAMPHWQAVVFCTRAAAGDVLLMLLCFWAVALLARSRSWVVHPRWPHVAGLVAAGVAGTIVLERLALAAGRWEYSPRMPTLLGIGLVPLLQWIILPPLVIWFTRRQLT